MSRDEPQGSAAGAGLTAAVVGLAGTELSAEERRLFAQKQPAGFILFARNCEDPKQVSALVRALREVADHIDVPVLIDQEGGRVARLKPPHWPKRPPLRLIGDLAEHDLDTARDAAWLHARLIASDLHPLGITVNCSPVLDLGLDGQTDAIGDRAFSDNPDIVAALGQATIDGYLAGGILPVIKHLPGHGRATVDSHIDLPCVRAGRADLAEADWLPFKANAKAPAGMTAHILFPELDPSACATQSARIIQDVVRGEIGFRGLLLSDDLSMEALGGSLGERAACARRAGCDLALHCNGDFAEMSAVLDAAGPLSGEPRSRFDEALARRPKEPEPFDPLAGSDRLMQLLEGAERAGKAIA